MRHPPISRRRFISRSTAFGIAAGLTPSSLAFGQSANNRLDVAFIGVGRRGEHNLQTMTGAGDVNVVALCDVSGDYLAAAAEKFPQARQFNDFRRLYDSGIAFDAVVISIPEHAHAVATMPALELGKHVYCEKPLTRNIREARLITEAAAKAGVVTQMGTQNHANANFRRVVELIRSGAIGPVKEVHVWVGRAWGRQTWEEAQQAEDIYYVLERPREGQPPPSDLNWDLWLGPAAERPFNPAYYPGPRWYRWWDFGNGTMSDLGSHWNDLPYWALELDAPRTIEASGPPPHADIAPASMRVVYEYGPRGDLPACTMTWYQGTEKPQLWTEAAIPQSNNGMLFVGEKGMLLSSYKEHKLLPEDRFTDFQAPEPWLPDSPGQHQEWLLACRTGAATGSPFSYAGPLTEANHLGNVAFRAGQKLTWDAAAMRAPNCPEADRFIGRNHEYRSGWSL